MKKLNKDEKRISYIMGLSLWFIPISVIFLLLDMEDWRVFQYKFTQSLLNISSPLIPALLCIWILSSFFSLSRIIQRNRDLEQEIYRLNKENAKTIDIEELKKNPNLFRHEFVKYIGEIIQIVDGDNITQIRLGVTKDIFGYTSDDLIFIQYNGYTNFDEGDIVTIYGKVHGEFSYESKTGNNVILPAILADEVIASK